MKIKILPQKLSEDQTHSLYLNLILKTAELEIKDVCPILDELKIEYIIG